MYSNLYALLQEPSLFEATLPSFHSQIESMLDEVSETVTHPSATVALQESSFSNLKRIQRVKKGVEEEIHRFCSACFASLFVRVTEMEALETDVWTFVWFSS